MMDNETKEGKDGRKRWIDIIKEILLGGKHNKKKDKSGDKKRKRWKDERGRR